MPDDKAHFWLRVLPEPFLVLGLRLLWGLRVSGREHLPTTGPVLVASNHCSVMDGPLLVLAAGHGLPLRFLGKRELFAIPLVGWYLRGLGMIPLERKGDVGALRQALGILEARGSMGIFPEGTRSKTGVPGSPKAGVGFLAGRSGAPVVPARIRGSFGFPFSRPLEVRFGPPVSFEGDPEDHASCLAFSQKVMDRISAL